MAFFWAFWQLFHRRQQDLLSNYAFNLPLHVEGPEANLASQRYWDNSLRDNFGKSLILHQNSSSSSFWKVGCYEQPETMYREFFMYCYIKNALGSFVLCMDLWARPDLSHVLRSLGFTNSLGCADQLNVDTFYDTIVQNHMHLCHRRSYKKSFKFGDAFKPRTPEVTWQHSNFHLKAQVFALARHTSSYFTRSGQTAFVHFWRCLPNT